MLIDYAYPCMMAEKALKEVHQCMLGRGYEEALEKAADCVAHLDAVMFAITHMRDEHARKAQAGV
jgi:hypothetical protein